MHISHEFPLQKRIADNVGTSYPLDSSSLDSSSLDLAQKKLARISLVEFMLL